MKRSLPIIIFLLCLIYAFIRYNVFKGVDYDLIPTYILNKSLSFASLILFALTFLPNVIFESFKRFDAVASKKNFSLAAYGMSVLHLVITLFILSPQLYPKFYSGGSFNVVGILTLFFGIISIVVFTLPFLASFQKMRKLLFKKEVGKIFRLAKLAYLLSLGHVITMGLSGWFNVSDWPASLPPITLLAFLVSMVCICMSISVTIMHAYQSRAERAA